MQQAGIEPNAFTYAALISAYGKGGKWEEAKQLFRDMTDRGIEANVVTVNALMAAFERGEQYPQVPRALRFLSPVQSPFSPPVARAEDRGMGCGICLPGPLE